MAFAYIALGVPAAVLWWNIAIHLRRSATSRRVQAEAARRAATVPCPALIAVAVEPAEAA